MSTLSFTSLSFVIIVSLTFLLYWNVKGACRNVVLVLGCYAFYAFAGVKLLALLFVMSMLTYLIGNAIIHSPHGPRGKMLLAMGVIANLGVLLAFKYLDFFVDNVNHLLHMLGMNSHLDMIRLLMPAGLSFYTFMLVSHLVDCRRDIFKGRNIRPDAFFAYVSFFPHMLAGPVDRSRLLLPQLAGEQKFSFEMAREGLWQILYGLVKKFVVADACAQAVDAVWADLYSHNSMTLMVIALLYSMQIYFDFSAFSDMAIGVGKLFGLRLMTNFNYPYFSRNVSEFWRKWHMSLTSWFTEYVYIPLGGSRRGRVRTFVNTVVVFGLCGLWHGANWGYALWGVLCGAMFVPYLLQKHPSKYKGQPTLRLSDVCKMAVTFVCITLAWVVFRGAQTDDYGLFTYYALLFKGTFGYQTVPFMLRALAYCLIFIVLEWTQRRREFALAGLGSLSRPVRWVIYIGLVVVLYIVYLTSPLEQSTDAFIYQNF